MGKRRRTRVHRRDRRKAKQSGWKRQGRKMGGAAVSGGELPTDSVTPDDRAIERLRRRFLSRWQR